MSLCVVDERQMGHNHKHPVEQGRGFVLVTEPWHIIWSSPPWELGRLAQILLLYRNRDSEKRSYSLSSLQSLSCVQLFATPWTAARQASLSFINSQSLLKLISIKLVMPSNHLILCYPLLLLPSVFPSIRVFSNESVLHIRWPKY